MALIVTQGGFDQGQDIGSSVIAALQQGLMLRMIEDVESGRREFGEDYLEALRKRNKDDPNGLFLRPTPLIENGLKFAGKRHEGQIRKASDEKRTVFSHVARVAEKLAKHTKDERVICGGILHDILEDTSCTEAELTNAFGNRIAGFVKDVTHSIALERQHGKRASWKQRKEQYLAHLRQAPEESLMISCADKIDNLQSLIEEFGKQGETVWKRFHAPKNEQEWYYASLHGLFSERLKHPMQREYALLFDSAHQLLWKPK